MNPFFCSRGHFTTFRRCSFDNILLTVGRSDPATNPFTHVYGEEFTTRIDFGSPKVVLENCLFEARTDSGSLGIVAVDDCSITLLNCAFRNRSDSW